MNDSRHFAIVFDAASAKAVSRYVSRGFFSPREFPQAFARMLLTGEFGLFVGVPLLLLLAARFVSIMMSSGQGAETMSQALTGIAVIWLVAGLVRISRYGPSSGIGCYVMEPKGSRSKLVGGLRMRRERNGRKIWIAGLLVEPAWRGASIGTALILAAFRLAQEQVAHGPVIVSVFAPSHPASRAIIEKQLGGMQTIQVTDPPSEALKRTIDRLEQALQKSSSSFEWRLSEDEHDFFLP
jgi:GNAT superfamily N-acetyltransferase